MKGIKKSNKINIMSIFLGLKPLSKMATYQSRSQPKNSCDLCGASCQTSYVCCNCLVEEENVVLLNILGAY
jgi:hypothetical protein